MKITLTRQRNCDFYLHERTVPEKPSANSSAARKPRASTRPSSVPTARSKPSARRKYLV